MRPKSSPNLMLLMTLPVVALLIVGWFLRDKRGTFTPPLPQTGPLRMVVTDVKFEQLKPREVAEGFDTKVTLTLGSAGLKPSGKKLFLSPQVREVSIGGLPKNAKWKLRDGVNIALSVNESRRDLGQKVNFVTVGGDREEPQVTFLINAASMPTSSTRTILRCRLHALIMTQNVRPNGTIMWSAGKTTSSFPFEFSLREPHQVVTSPSGFSRVPQIKATKVTTTYEQSFSGKPEPVINVAVSLEYQDRMNFFRKARPDFDFGTPYIEDEKGNRYTKFDYGNGLTTGIAPNGYGSSEGSNVIQTNFRVPITQIPNSAGKLTFKTLISVGESWPFLLSVVVRTKAESVPPKPSPFEIVRTHVGEIDLDDSEFKSKDTGVRLWIRYKNKNFLGEFDKCQFSGDWSTTLEVEKWPDRVLSIGYYLPSYDKKTGLYSLAYAFRIKHIPASAGRIIFKAEIGMKGYKFLPVSVVVRK